MVINGNPVDTLGNPITGISGADKRPIPRIYADDFCGEADFVFNSSGVGLRVSTSESFDFAPGGGMWGWKWDSGKNIYKSDSDHVEQGVYCVDGNMEIANNLGVPGSPWEVTFLVEGSVQISGNPYLKPAHSKDIVIIAEGDLKLNGNPAGGPFVKNERRYTELRGEVVKFVGLAKELHHAAVRGDDDEFESIKDRVPAQVETVIDMARQVRGRSNLLRLGD